MEYLQYICENCPKMCYVCLKMIQQEKGMPNADLQSTRRIEVLQMLL